MALAAGTRLGAYEVLLPLGAGGIGEMYRARDMKLNHDVALKVLPDFFTADVERLARFKREAQLLAALNHPNIGAIYGFEDSGGVQALVLELVDGPTLADRIAEPPAPTRPTDTHPAADWMIPCARRHQTPQAHSHATDHPAWDRAQATAAARPCARGASMP